MARYSTKKARFLQEEHDQYKPQRAAKKLKKRARRIERRTTKRPSIDYM